MDGVDIHENNKKRFNLPERRTAKIFVFRLIYGGQAYSYAHDTDFNHISKSTDYWQSIIDAFYDKYPTIGRWHEGLVRTVLDKGQLVMPTGRTYTFDRADVAKRLWYWRPKILNYPVQGLGADLVAIGRVTLWKRIRAAGLQNKVLFISTVHDSLDLDVNNLQEPLDKRNELCYTICKMVKTSFEDVPKNFNNLFGAEFDLPVNVEIGSGPNLATLTPYKD